MSYLPTYGVSAKCGSECCARGYISLILTGAPKDIAIAVLHSLCEQLKKLVSEIPNMAIHVKVQLLDNIFEPHFFKEFEI